MVALSSYYISYFQQPYDPENLKEVFSRLSFLQKTETSKVIKSSSFLSTIKSDFEVQIVLKKT